MCLDTVSQLPLNQEGQTIQVILNSTANVLDCLSLSETLNTQALVRGTAIYLSYLSSPLVVDPPTYLPLENHYLKVFLKKGVSEEAGLAFNQELKSNALVKETHFFPDISFTQIKTLCRARLLRAHLRIQKCIEETDELLALLERRRDK